MRHVLDRHKYKFQEMLIMVMTHDIRTRNVNHVVHEVLQKKEYIHL